MKNFYTIKKTVTNIEVYFTEWEKISINQIAEKGLTFKFYKEFTKLIKKGEIHSKVSTLPKKPHR